MDKRISDVFNEAIKRNPKIADRLNGGRPRMRVAASLARLRTALGYTQRMIADRMRTPQSNVARIEKASGNLQTTESLVAYAHACGMTVGLVFLRPEGETFEIAEAAAIGSERADRFLQDLITLDESALAATPESVSEDAAERATAREARAFYHD